MTPQLSVINQLHVTSDLVIARGGQQKASYYQAETLAALGGKVGLWFGARDGRSYADIQPGDSALQLFGYEGRCGLIRDRECIHSIFHAMESVKADVVHLHGMWLPEYKTAFKVAKRSNLPVVISPHGTLTPWDLSKKKWKKRLAMLLYQKAILAKVDMFFATSQVEADGLRLLGLKQPIAVVPIGVDIPVGINSTIEQESDGRVVLYMGRIHPGKGVLDLVEAWRLNRRPTWKLRIAGPAISSIELSYRRLVEKKIDEYGLASEIELLGMLDGSAKRNAFEAADIFILPTYSENFGIVVAEALAHGLPVITTTGAPWNELVEYNCGWWTSPGAVGISKALSSAMAMTPDELSEMGRRGRKLIIDNYSWRHIGASSLEAYKWLLDKSRPKPSFIID